MSDDRTPKSDKPVIAVTVGDCAGVGPELALAVAANEGVQQRCHPVIISPRGVLNKVAERIGQSPPKRKSPAQQELPNTIHDASELRSMRSAIWEVGQVDENDLTPGEFSAQTGLASFQCVDFAIDETIKGTFSAMVTGPIQKEAWHLADVPFIGHTELLADRTRTSDYCMMLTSDTISCVLCTVHVPIADVAAMLSSDLIYRAICLGAAALRKRLGHAPRVGILGLNPHAGENGLISHDEEARLIVPAVERGRAEGLDLMGPLSPDTAFTPSMRSQVDVYICMYHDQGLIPLKTISFDDAVNVTLGLPIVRTSVDHGTAMDIAWQGVASGTSMLAAIHMAIDLCDN